MLSQEEVNQLFAYHGGQLHWKEHKHNRKVKRAGTRKDTGYWKIQFDNKVYLEHRLVWVMFNGGIPDGLTIDHIDNDRLNNNIENLRLATMSQNACNRRIHQNNHSGFKGIAWHKGSCSWHAKVYVRGKSYSLGYYKTSWQAHEAYKIGSAQLHGEFSNAG